MRNESKRIALGAAVAIVVAVLFQAGCGGDGSQEDGLPSLALNHVMLVVDSETYEAVRDSEFLNSRLAAVEERMTLADGGESFLGTYLYGAHTYIEFFESNPNDLSEGSGLALGTEALGGLERVASALAAGREAAPKPVQRFRVRDADQVPWFSWVGIGTDDPGTTFWPWVMEYHPDYLRRWYDDAAPEGSGITRAEHRARDYSPSRLLNDIVRISVALAAEEAGPLIRDLQTLGWTVRRESEVQVLTGPDLELRIEPADGDRHGVLELGLKLGRVDEAGAPTHRLGSSTLSFHGDGTATWSFR